LNLVDSSGWLEYFAGGKNAEVFAPAIENTKELIVSTINIYEIYKKILAERDEHSAAEGIGMMQQAKIIDISFSISIHAATISHQFKLPMADSLIYATALQSEAIVWTQDKDFKGLKNVKYIKK
jgi:predicted nucleic acid-binding protein